MANVSANLISHLKKYSPTKIILFGSQARGEADRYSDIDILIIKETKKRFLQRLREVALLLPKDSPPVNLFVYNNEEIKAMRRVKNPFIEKVFQEGKIIYEAKSG